MLGLGSRTGVHSALGPVAYCFGVADGDAAGIDVDSGLVGNGCGVTDPVGIPGSKLAGRTVLIIDNASPLRSRPSRSSVGGWIPARFWYTLKLTLLRSSPRGIEPVGLALGLSGGVGPPKAAKTPRLNIVS